MTQNISELTWKYVDKWAAAKPDAECVAFEDERLTWRQFADRVDKTARAFIAAGVAKGDRVAMLSMARPEFLVTYMAAGKAGAVWLGLTPKFTLDELAFQVGDSKPTVLVTVREYMGADISKNVIELMNRFDFLKKVLVIGEPFEGAESFEEFTAHDRPEVTDELKSRMESGRGEDDALLLYTSGSTGKPKGVVHTHRGIIENVKVQVEKFHFHENSRGLLHFPINHVAADVEIGFACIFGGGSLVCMDRFDPEKSLEVIQKEKITVIGQVPVMFLLQMKQPKFFETDFSSVEQFVWAGAAAPSVMLNVLENICRNSGAMLMTGYGSTELCGFVTYTEKGADRETLEKTAGKIAENFELKIVDDARAELPRGEIGEIAVRGPFLMSRYFNNPEATAATVDADGWYYTNDLAFMDEKGYIRITGRKSEMFKTGGENVYPREIEDVIESHGAVLFAAVVAVPDPMFQEVGWAFVMTIPGQNVTEDELKLHCKDRLANFKVPKKFIVRPLLPMLQSGKIDKMALKKEVAQTLEKEKA